MHACHSLQGPSSAGGRLALEHAFFWKFWAHSDISFAMAALAFSLACDRSDRICMSIANIPKRTVLRRMTLTPSCSHLDKIAGALGWSLTADRKLLNQPRRAAFPPFFGLLPTPDPSSQSLSESSESCGRRGRTLPTSLSPCSLFLFLTLSRLPLASSPRPDAWFRSNVLLKSVLPAAGVRVNLPESSSSRSHSGVSAGISEVSVRAGLDSAPEYSENTKSSSRLCGVVKAGFRNAGADGLRCSWGLKNDTCGGRGWACGLSGEPAGGPPNANGLGLGERNLDGELNVAMGRGV